MSISRARLEQIIREEVTDLLGERCQKGYKTHPTQKTKEMYGKTYRNCIKAEEKEARREEKKRQKEAEKQAADAAVIEEHAQDQQEKRDQGVDEKDITCAAVSQSGNRCRKKVLPGQKFCTIHEEVEQGNTRVQCSHVKKDGKRCKMKTKNKSGLCYYHD